MDFHIELVHLKEDLLKEIKKLDKKFTDIHKKESINVKEDVLTPLDKINIMLKKTDQMFKAVTDQQIKIDKITELETFKNRTNDVVLAHEIRIKGLSKDLEDIKFKYDREITQNLTVSGFIGGSCRFKTISEYLLFNMDDITKLKMEKELMKKETKELKTKLDSMIKNTLNLVDNSVKRSNLYTDNKQKNFETLLENKYKEFNEKIMEMKTMTLSNEKFVKEQLIKITNVASELNYIKDNVEEVLDKKLSEMKSNINEMKSKIDKINNDKFYKSLDNFNNINKISGNFNNTEEKNIFNSNKKISIIKKPDFNFNIKNNSFKRTNQIEKNIHNENINNRNQKYNNSSFKIKENRKINNFMNQKTIEKNNSNEYLPKFENKKEINLAGKQNNMINQNNIRTYNELKYKLKPKNVKQKENKIIYNSNDKIESYSIEGKIASERKMINLGNKSNREIKEIKKEKIIEINDQINLSDGEQEKKISKIIKKNRKKLERKLNKYSIIKIDKNYAIEKDKKENKIESYEKNIINFTDYNFYNKRDLNDFHIYKDDIHNLKRYPFHKIYKNENSDFSSQKANSDINLDININDNSSNKLQASQRVNNIYYPNKEQIKNLKHKNYLIKEFLIRHNTNPNNKSEPKQPKINSNEENNKLYETANNFYNYNEYKNRSNTLDKINSFPPPLIKDNENYINRRDVETQSNIAIKNSKIPERFNLKFISLDNQFKLALSKKKFQIRNNPELFFSTPITNVFKTFQNRKNKEVINSSNK